jgi:NAD(P)-dependent dehydrogenase (short-subunit alcohol dehydrogenase family)
MSQQLKNKRTLVTGGSRGIGAAIVKRLAREGAHVGLCDALVGQAFQPDASNPDSWSLGNRRQPGKPDLPMRRKAPATCSARQVL